MKYFDWNKEKNLWLIENRGISFETIVACYEQDKVLAVIDGTAPREHQKKLIVQVDDYIFVVPFVEDDFKIFLKTIYPSHEATK
jgi:uncharacterized DUF497 family protein